MTEILVFGVGLLVSMLVIFGIFSRVPLQMRDPVELPGTNIVQDKN